MWATWMVLGGCAPAGADTVNTAMASWVEVACERDGDRWVVPEVTEPGPLVAWSRDGSTWRLFPYSGAGGAEIPAGAALSLGGLSGDPAECRVFVAR